MSTLGELLAEHTVLPGDAVDHLHALVGEWQLLADLSFADYLMWVRRDDGALVCVAQCRPNTSPTALLTDSVGSVAEADEWPQVTAAFESGTIGEADVEAVPVRHGGKVVAWVVRIFFRITGEQGFQPDHCKSGNGNPAAGTDPLGTHIPCTYSPWNRRRQVQQSALYGRFQSKDFVRQPRSSAPQEA